MIESVYFDLNVKARNWLTLGYLAGALEGLREKLANVKASGRGEVAPRIMGDVITFAERLHRSIEEARP